MTSLTSWFLSLLHMVPTILMLCATWMAWRRLRRPVGWFLAGGLGLALVASLFTLATSLLISMRGSPELASRFYPMASMLGAIGWIVFAVGYWQMLEVPGGAAQFPPTGPVADDGLPSAAVAPAVPVAPQRLFANHLAVISLSLAAASLIVAALTPATCWLLSERTTGWDSLGAVVMALFAHAILAWLLALGSVICGLRVVRTHKAALWWLVPMMLVVAAGVFGVLLTMFGR
jgi:hypothetical protein